MDKRALFLRSLPLAFIVVGLMVGTGCRSESGQRPSDKVTPTPVKRETPSSVNLTGTEWVLVSLDGQPPIQGSRITLMLAEGQLKGIAGCNRYGGTYRQEGNRLTV